MASKDVLGIQHKAAAPSGGTSPDDEQQTPQRSPCTPRLATERKYINMLYTFRNSEVSLNAFHRLQINAEPVAERDACPLKLCASPSHRPSRRCQDQFLGHSVM